MGFSRRTTMAMTLIFNCEKLRAQILLNLVLDFSLYCHNYSYRSLCQTQINFAPDQLLKAIQAIQTAVRDRGRIVFACQRGRSGRAIQ